MRIPARFNGPPGSANGGYTCGLVAGLLGAPSAEVTLRSPPPLDVEMAVERDADVVRVSHGDMLVVEGRAAVLDVEPPEPLTPKEAGEAAWRGYERWAGKHPFPTCFVCGPERTAGDGLRVFPAEIGDGRFAASWTPEGEGEVAPEHVWAALDCPTAAPLANYGDGPPIVLAKLHASLDAPVAAGRAYALVAKELSRDGRKREAVCALFDGDGAVLARSRALWIELRQA